MTERLPDRLVQIDARWLESALQEKFPGVRLASLDFVETLQGTSTKALLRVDYADRNRHIDLPSDIWIKGNFADDRQFMADMDIYTNEVRFYRDYQGQCGVNSPQCFYARSDDATGQGILLLENLHQRPVRFGRGRDSLNERSALQLMEMLATLHARWWQSPLLATDFAWTVDPLPDGHVGAYYREMCQPTNWANRCAQVHALGLPRSLLDHEQMIPAMARLQQIDRGEPQCILHGDAHFANLFVEADGRPGLFDWQCLRHGHWAHDVNYCLVSALDIEDRRAWEKALLSHYLDALRAEFHRLERDCAPPSFDEAWLAFRQQNLYGLFMWICNTNDLQPQENNIAFTLRYAIAAVDHQTLQLLR